MDIADPHSVDGKKNLWERTGGHSCPGASPHHIRGYMIKKRKKKKEQEGNHRVYTGLNSSPTQVLYILAPKRSEGQFGIPEVQNRQVRRDGGEHVTPLTH